MPALFILLLVAAVWLGIGYLGPFDADRQRLKQYAAIQGVKLGDIHPAPLIGLTKLCVPFPYPLPYGRSATRFFSVQFTEANGHRSKAVIALDRDYQGQLQVIRGRTETA